MTSVETPQRDSGIGEPAEQRQEFLRAFTEHGWARPGIERPTARPHVTLVVATIAMVAALLAGLAMQLISPVKLPRSAPAAAPKPTLAPTYAAVAGWDCAAADDHGFVVNGRQSTWATIGHGGWAQDGCHGDFEAVPFAGTTSASAATAEWWFALGKAMKRCQVLVFLPVPDRTVYEPVRSVTYSVLNGPGGAEFARFTVDQAASAGTWILGGNYPVGTAGIAVRLSNAGRSPSARAGLAVAQVKVGCTG